LVIAPWTHYEWTLEVASMITGRVLGRFAVHMYGALTEAGRALKKAVDAGRLPSGMATP
jgi:hypothetical protein